MDTLEVDAQDLISHRTENEQGFPSDGKLGHLHLKHIIW